MMLDYHAGELASLFPKPIPEAPQKFLDWRGKSLVSMLNVSVEMIETVLEVAAFLKAADLERKASCRWAYPRTLALVFEKPSLRTRVSFEAGMTHLGGHAIYLGPTEIGLGKRESPADVASALSRWVDVIAARVYRHETVLELATNATIPVINALCDLEHPLQAFADLLTLQEQKGTFGKHIKLAYVGDGNNVLHSLLIACAKMGVSIAAGCPEGYLPAERYVQEAKKISQELNTGADITITTDPTEAVQGADAIYGDVWASMGQEEEAEARKVLFKPYQINKSLTAQAKPDAIVMHCLPAHLDEEITKDVFDAHKTVIMDQAENRMHTQKAIVALMLTK